MRYRAAASALKRAAAAAARFEIPKGVKIAAGIVVAAVLALALGCCMPAGVMMVAPGCGGGVMILRAAFEAFPWLYFMVLRFAGPRAAVAAATLAFSVGGPLCASVIFFNETGGVRPLLLHHRAMYYHLSILHDFLSISVWCYSGNVMYGQDVLFPVLV